MNVWALTVDGSGYIFAGTDSGVFRSRDAQLPRFGSSLTSPEASRGQPVLVQAIVSDDVGVNSVRVFYRRGGETGFASLPMVQTSPDSGSGLYRAMIPADFVTPRGIEYYVRAWDVFENTNRFPSLGIVSVQVKVDSLLKSIVRYGSEQNDYRLVSFPLTLAEPAPASVLSSLGDYDNKKWRFYELGADQQTYEYPQIEPMTPGRAFWLIVKEPGKTLNTGAGKTLYTDTVFAIPVHPRWNFVSSPFNFDIPLRNVRLQRDTAALDIRTYNGVWETAVTALKPFEGYAVFAEDFDTLLINPNFSDSTLASPAAPPMPWSIRILAQCQRAHDVDNLAAIVPHSFPRRDEFDRPEPPVIGEYVSAYFPHREWNALAKAYCIDARSEPSESEVWDFEVKTNIRDKVNLSFEGTAGVPSEFEVWLVDEALQITQNLRESPTYFFAGSEQPKTLKLVVGKHDFISQQLAEIDLVPATYELSQNFPNPFNPVTTIRYGLPQAERVTLKIYNLLGEEVATLVNDEHKAPGYHVAIWDGRGKNGSIAASGVYVYRMHVGSFAMTRKLLMVK